MYVPSLSSTEVDIGTGGLPIYSDGQERGTAVSQDQEGAPPPYWAVLNKFSGTQNWPHQTVILPGECWDFFSFLSFLHHALYFVIILMLIYALNVC